MTPFKKVAEMKRIVFPACATIVLLLSLSHPLAFGEGNGTHPAQVFQLPPDTRLSEHIYGNLPGLANVGRVSPGIYRGAQPTADGYAILKKMGIRTVVNLRTSTSEKKDVEAVGIRSVEVPITMSDDRLKEKVERVVALMADPANRPVFIHCHLGQDRTGIVVAAYRLKMEGWSLADAEAEMESFGFNHVWVQFKHFIRKYAADLKR